MSRRFRSFPALSFRSAPTISRTSSGASCGICGRKIPDRKNWAAVSCSCRTKPRSWTCFPSISNAWRGSSSKMAALRATPPFWPAALASPWLAKSAMSSIAWLPAAPSAWMAQPAWSSSTPQRRAALRSRALPAKPAAPGNVVSPRRGPAQARGQYQLVERSRPRRRRGDHGHRLVPQRVLVPGPAQLADRG